MSTISCTCLSSSGLLPNPISITDVKARAPGQNGQNVLFSFVLISVPGGKNEMDGTSKKHASLPYLKVICIHSENSNTS